MTLQGSKDLKHKIRRMKTKLGRKPQQAVDRSAATITADMRANVAFNDAIASSELLNGIVYRPQADGGVVIESKAAHSGYVEFGTGPRHVYNPYTRRYDAPDFSGSLVASLTEWAIVKPTLMVDDPSSFAWAVARKISGQTDEPGGTDPQPFFIPAWESGKDQLISSIEEAVEDAVKYS